MKKILYIAFALILSVSVYAQVDRSVQPKPGPDPKINLGKAKDFQLPNGLKVLVVENHKLPRVTFSLIVDNLPSVEGEIKGVDDLASSMMGNGTSKISKDKYNEQIDYYGASISFSVTNINGSTLSRYFPEVLSLVAQGALDPLLTEEELASERAKLLDGIKAEEKSVPSIAGRVRSALLYGKSHPRGEYLTDVTVNKVTLSDVKNYYKANFVPANAYLIVVGDVKFDEVKKLVTSNFSSWKKAPAPISVYAEPANLAKAEINFVDVPNAVQTELSVSNITSLKMTDPDYFAALLANQILGGGGEGRLFINLREAHGWTYGAYSGIRGDRYVSDFTASTSVRSNATDSAVVEILKEIEKVRTTLATQEDLDLAKAKYVGNFVMNTEKPQTIAGYAFNERTQSLPADFYENYIKNVNAVTLEQVQAAAQKYFMPDVTRIVVVGKASDVLPGLERLNIPISYYDRYANQTEKPQEQEVSADVTPRSVIAKYIDAVGGKDKLSAVESVVGTAKASIQGNELTLIQKIGKDKSAQEMSMMGMTMFKLVFNKGTGYMVMQGKRKEMDSKELDDMKFTAPFPEILFINSDDLKLKGVEEGAYVLELGNKTYYYDMTSGLKVAEAVAKEVAPGNIVNQKVYLSDYRDINGIKLPYKSTMNMGGMEIEMNVTDVKINEGITDADFQ